MKSYTDLNQSGCLSKILPIESADMTMTWRKSYDYTAIDIPYYLYSGIGIPCWSFTALFSAIPQEIFDGEYIINITKGRDNKWILTYDHCENRNHSYYGLSSSADNLVDACYELVLKLHKRNLLH